MKALFIAALACTAAAYDVNDKDANHINAAIDFTADGELDKAIESFRYLVTRWPVIPLLLTRTWSQGCHQIQRKFD